MKRFAQVAVDNDPECVTAPSRSLYRFRINALRNLNDQRGVLADVDTLLRMCPDEEGSLLEWRAEALVALECYEKSGQPPRELNQGCSYGRSVILAKGALSR